jgi:hypothetical protein
LKVQHAMVNLQIEIVIKLQGANHDRTSPCDQDSQIH